MQSTANHLQRPEVVAEDKILVQYFSAVTVSIECGAAISSDWVV